MRGRHRRGSHKPRISLILALALMVGAIAAPASATKPDPDSDLESGHKIWICHATSSLTNPYVKILIDIAAWDIEDPDSNDHGPMHHLREKDGIVWGDYALENPEAECSIPDDEEKVECPDGTLVDYVVEFPGAKMYLNAPTQTVVIDIPAGTYDVILISGDTRRGKVIQDHEEWRLDGDTPSGYSHDVSDPVMSNGTVMDVTGEPTYGLSVVFLGDVTSVTARHNSAYAANGTDDSVIPEYACLTKAGATTAGADL